MHRAAWIDKAKDREWRRENLYILPVVALAAIVIWYALVDWTPPVRNVWGEASPMEVNRAGVYCIDWHAQRDRICRRETEHRFVDRLGVSHKLDLAPGIWRPNKGRDEWRRCFYAPAGAGFDWGEHRADISFFCNPLHNWFPIKVETPGVPVRIIPREGEK